MAGMKIGECTLLDHITFKRGGSGRLVAAGSFALALSLMPAHALAQTDQQGQSVAERSAPEYTNRPIKVGSFDLTPTLSVDANYNDNIFALDSNEIDDVLVTVTPRVVLSRSRPDQTTRIALSAGFRRYFDAISENSERYSADINTRQGRGSGVEWRLGARVARNFEQRRDISSFNEPSTPVTFTEFRGTAGATFDLGSLSVSVDGTAKAVEYSGEFEQGGTVFDLSFRDFQTYEGRVRATFARSRNQEFYVQVTADSRRYELAPLFIRGVPSGFIDRSSKGGRLELGYRRQITELLYLDTSAGYLLQDFDDPANGEVDGVAFTADLLWNATPLTSVRFRGVRQIDDSINPEFAGLVRTEGEVQVEHELMRNLVLIGRAGYSDFNQTNSPLDGDQYNLSAEARYRLNRALGFNLQAERFDRSGLVGFEQNLVRAGVTYNF